MKSSCSTARDVFLMVFVSFALTSGCNQKKINKHQPPIENTVRVSLSSSGAEGNLEAVNDSLGISDDGRFVAFTSKATNLVPGDLNNMADVFLRDNVGRTLQLVSISLSGGPSNGPSGTPSLSGDGRFVCFSSLATNLTADIITPGKRQIYVRDMTGDASAIPPLPVKTYLVSRASGATGTIADNDCDNPKISGDGIYVVFESTSNLLDGVPGAGDDNDALSDIYRRKWFDFGPNQFITDLVTFVSFAGPGSLNKGNGDSFRPAVSRTGRFVAYESTASNLVTATGDGGPDLNVVMDVFVRDMQTTQTVRCSVEVAGTIEPNTLDGDSRSATISDDGQFVAFRSVSGVLSPLAQDAVPNIFVRSWNTIPPVTEVLSVHTSGATGGQNCDRPTISGDGTKIAWQSPSSALVNGDSNGVLDIFLRNRVSQETSRQSVQTFGGQLDGQSGIPAYSRDGRYIVFWSQATNGVDDDTNGAADIYLRGPPFK